MSKKWPLRLLHRITPAIPTLAVRHLCPRSLASLHTGLRVVLLPSLHTNLLLVLLLVLTEAAISRLRVDISQPTSRLLLAHLRPPTNLLRARLSKADSTIHTAALLQTHTVVLPKTRTVVLPKTRMVVLPQTHTALLPLLPNRPRRPLLPPCLQRALKRKANLASMAALSLRRPPEVWDLVLVWLSLVTPFNAHCFFSARFGGWKQYCQLDFLISIYLHGFHSSPAPRLLQCIYLSYSSVI